MTKTICDISGTIPASNYKIVKQDGAVELSIDLCEKCAKKVMDHVRGQQKVSGVQAVIEKDIDKEKDA